MRQRGAETLVTEEPYERIVHVRICGGAGWVTTGSTRKPDFPVAYREYLREISLPVYSKMRDRDVQDVIDVVTDIVMAFLGTSAANLDARSTSEYLYTDTRLCKASSPGWHHFDRLAGRMPDKLRHLDTDGSWSTSGSHGWVSGSGLPLVGNRAGCPTFVRVETASVSERVVIDRQAEQLLHDCRPATLTADNRDPQATRIRRWAKRGVLLVTPALQGTRG